MNKKEENARMLDPMRFKVTKNMPYVQGGPDNNNPMNVTDNASPQFKHQVSMVTTPTELCTDGNRNG